MSDPFGPLRYYHCDERVPETIVEHLRDHQWIFMFQSRDEFAMFLANEIEIPRQEVTRLRSLLRQKDMEITRLRACAALEHVRQQAQALIDYEDAGPDDPAGKSWLHWEEKFEALRAALKAAPQ
jgi:hypothetical protein